MNINFAAAANPSRVARKSPAESRPPAPAGDTYSSLLAGLISIGEQLKIQSIAMEHARNRAAKQDWTGVQIALAVLCCAAGDIRKIAAAANEKITGEQ